MKPFRVIVQTPETDNVITSLTTLSNELAAIGTDTTPVPVLSNAKSGDYAYSSLGAPSHAVSGTVVYSNPFTPTGEKITIALAAFAPGGATIDDTGYLWVECDVTGGTAYKFLAGSTIQFSSIPNNGRNLTAIVDTRGGNCRIAIKLGTITGTGVFGYNVGVLN